jgi:hypothetical protein
MTTARGGGIRKTRPLKGLTIRVALRQVELHLLLLLLTVELLLIAYLPTDQPLVDPNGRHEISSRPQMIPPVRLLAQTRVTLENL